MKTITSVEIKRWYIEGDVTKILIENEELLQRLEKKIKSNTDQTLSYKTNVKGKMTHWDYFKRDEDFKELVSLYYKICGRYGLWQEKQDNNNIYHFTVLNAWGNILIKNDKVIRHHHLGTDYSSVLYFDNKAPLCTDAGKIETTRGLIITIPTYLFHWVEKIDKDVERYTLAWNWTFTKAWDFKETQEELLK